MTPHARLQADDAFARWFIDDYLRAELPEVLALGRPALTARVLSGRRRAEGFGLDTVDAQAHFILLMFTFGPGFFRFDGFRQILERREIPAMARIEALYVGVTNEQAEQALANADPRGWHPEALDTAA